MEREGQRQRTWMKEGLMGHGKGGFKSSLKVLGLET